MKRSIGLIGYGGFGRFLHRAWSGIDDVQVVAVSDADPTRNPGGISFYADWHDLVSDNDVEIVAVATPPSTHAAIACAALSSGKHTLVEKPVATTAEDAHRILEERDRAGLVATVDFMLRFNPIVEALHTWSHSGCFGKLRRVAVENYAQDESLPPNHWFWNRAISGGILVEHAVHFFDVVQWCSGSRPVHIDGVALRRNSEQEDRMMATVIYEDGLVVTHYHAFAGPDFFERTSMRFVFDLLQLDVYGWIPLSGHLSAIVNRQSEKELDRLPGLRVLSRRPSGEIKSIAHPVGPSLGVGRTVHVAGRPYTMEGTVEAEFALPVSKPEAYVDCLQALMSDFVAGVADADHRLRVTLEDGIASLEIALSATKEAHRRSGDRPL